MIEPPHFIAWPLLLTQIANRWLQRGCGLVKYCIGNTVRAALAMTLYFSFWIAAAAQQS